MSGSWKGYRGSPGERWTQWRPSRWRYEGPVKKRFLRLLAVALPLLAGSALALEPAEGPAQEESVADPGSGEEGSAEEIMLQEASIPDG